MVSVNTIDIAGKPEEWVRLLCTIADMVVLSAAIVSKNTMLREPRHTSILSGHGFINELINGHEGRFKDSLRMRPSTFHAICKDLRDVGLEDSLHVSVEEQLAIFLHITGHNYSY
jgi:hypothetical protein